MSIRFLPVRASLLVAITVLCVAACSGSGGTPGSASNPGGNGPTAPAANSTNNPPAPAASAACTNPEGQVVGGAGGTNAALIGAALCGMADIDPCSMLKPADVQALFSVTLAASTTDHLGTCSWPLGDPSKGDGLDVFVNVGEGEGPLDEDMGPASALTAITGIGDRANWNLLAGYFPHLGAVKGQATCELTAGGGNGQLSVHSTGSGIFAQIDRPALAGFMQQFGNLCNEIFAGLGASASGPTLTPAPVAATAAAPSGQTSVRIGNFYADQNLKPGPALDLYDTQHGQAATPILTAVPYGSFSAYVQPSESNSVTTLYVLPTGEDPVANQADAKGIGGYQDDGSHLQETFILASEGKLGSGCFGPGPICELDTSSVVESGDDANGDAGPVTSPPPAGQADLLVSTHVVDDEGLHGAFYFFVDDSCDPPVNGDAAQEPGLPYLFPTSGPGMSIFPVTPGTHQISVAEYSGGSTPTCDALKPRQGQMSVDVTAGQQLFVYLYGTDLTDVHLAVAPIQPPAQ